MVGVSLLPFIIHLILYKSVVYSIGVTVEHCFLTKVSEISPEISRESPYEIIYNLNETMVEIANTISPYEHAELSIFDECMQTYEPQMYNDRSFGDGSYGGNIVTYCSGYAQKIIPHILLKMKKIADHALAVNKLGQNVDTVDGLGLRCVEFLFYREGMSLNMHTDTDSYFTMIVAMSSPNDYDGGDFIIESTHSGAYSVRPDLYTGIIFNSLQNHGNQRQFIVISTQG